MAWRGVASCSISAGDMCRMHAGELRWVRTQDQYRDNKGESWGWGWTLLDSTVTFQSCSPHWGSAPEN